MLISFICLLFFFGRFLLLLFLFLDSSVTGHMRERVESLVIASFCI